ncbi:hypothetical protein [Desertibaculum subflavum]|uniref:hypothetical protein n=1 Tax=Desertibaculum subflavum TaxID=2268458 RepID=UPI000E66BDBB
MSALPKLAAGPAAIDLLLYARDPGAANVVVAARAAMLGDAPCPLPLQVLAYRLGSRPRCAVFAKSYARNSFEAAGVDAVDWSSAVPAGGRDAAIHRLLTRHSPRAVLTGTSDIDDDDDIALWRAAARFGVPSYAVVDSPASIRARFTDRNGETCFPTEILAPTKAARDEIVALGARPGAVAVAGQIHLDRLRAEAFFRDTTAANRLRVHWGAGLGDSVILFASECGREMAAQGRPAPYDEVETLGRLLDFVERGDKIGAIETETRPTLVVVRPHPRDVAAKFDAVTANRKARVIVSAAGTPKEAIMAADLAAGMNSMLLHEAKALGRPVVSLVGIEI